MLERTAFGKRVYAVGSNRTVAILSGIRADRIKIQCLMIVGFTASLAGLVSVSRLGAVSPNTGEGLEFEVIAAVVIGGTSLYGGQGKILRTIIGVIIIALTRNFLNLARIEIFWQGFATGTIILRPSSSRRCSAASRAAMRLKNCTAGRTRMNPTETRKLGKHRRGAHSARLRNGAPLGELFVRVDEADRRRDAAGGVGRRHSLLRHGALLRPRA